MNILNLAEYYIFIIQIFELDRIYIQFLLLLLLTINLNIYIYNLVINKVNI